jgi:hypothetical protein
VAWLATVNVNIDQAGRDYFPRRVDDRCTAEVGLGGWAHFLDDTIGKNDIAYFVSPGGGIYHSSVLDYDLGHACLAL